MTCTLRQSLFVIVLASAGPVAACAEEVSVRDVFTKPSWPTEPYIIDFNAGIDSNWTSPIDLGDTATTDVFASVGRGYDPIRGKVLSTACVEGTEPDHQFGNGIIARTFFDQVSDVKSHQKASGSSLGFSALIKTVALGFGSSEARGRYFNSVDRYGRVYSRVVTKATERRNVRWSADAREWIKNDVGKFLRQCGTRFVRGVYFGHLLDMTVRFKLREDQQATADATALSLGVEKLFSASLGTSEAEKDVTLRASAKMMSLGIGAYSLPPAPGALRAKPTPGAANAGASAGASTGPQPKPADAPAPAAPPAAEQPTEARQPASDTAQPGPVATPSEPQKAQVGPVENLFNYYNYDYRSAVLAAPVDSALPLYIIVEDYGTTNNLPNTSNIPGWTEAMIRTVTSRADLYDDLISSISDLNYAVENGPVDRVNLFYKGTGADAQVKLVEANKLLKAFQKAMQTCERLSLAGKPQDDAERDVVEVCDAELDSALNADKLANIRLDRIYKARPASQ